MRLHLRVEEDGAGTLLINVNQTLHLNRTAASMAYLILEGKPFLEAMRLLKKQYATNTKQLEQDYHSFIDTLAALIEPQGVCPICDLDLNVLAPFSTKPSAPYRMDLALTYECNNDCFHCYNVKERHTVHMNVTEWKRAIDKIWELRIPHVVFTGGEPTLHPALPVLIAYAQNKGLVTGLNTNGRLLSHANYLQTLVDAGLEHVQITLESHLPEIHDDIVQCSAAWQETVAGLRLALQSKLYLMTNTTLLRQNIPYLKDTLAFLVELGVPTVGLNALIHAGRGKMVEHPLKENELEGLLKLARESTQRHDQRLIWYTPTRYCRFDPVEQGLGVKGCTAALYNMCIEPNGKVLPCQSYYQAVGHILENRWEDIWQHDLCLWLRERHYAPTQCQTCALINECGAGCPLSSP